MLDWMPIQRFLEFLDFYFAFEHRDGGQQPVRMTGPAVTVFEGEIEI